MTESSETILDGDCGKLLLLQAEFDGELDAAQAAALAEHRANCAVCRRNETLLAATHGALRRATYHRADPELLRAVVSRIGTETPPVRRPPPPARRRASMPWRGLA
ncbi:MAG: hypothetical protein KGO22_05425, partial [Gammaproteobacteria bacterium]|nr:hypothetical protein [Gammaproteobacteria bacterium]